jgi:hypothetical protein
MSARRGAGGKAMLGGSVTQVSAEGYETMRDARREATTRIEMRWNIGTGLPTHAPRLNVMTRLIPICSDSKIN